MADVANKETTASARAQVARAWDVIEDRKRVLKGKGVPKPVETLAGRPKRKTAERSFIDPGEASDNPPTPTSGHSAEPAKAPHSPRPNDTDPPAAAS